MNRQPPRRSVLHLLLSALTRKAPEQAKGHVQPLHLPTPDDRDAWQTYLKAQSQPWRTEPEINPNRQVELTQCRAIVPDSEKGIYPFKGMKLSRADVEWLLATHESGRGPVDWSDEGQRKREGVDLRGADLREVNLKGLPLARMHGGLTLWEVRPSPTTESFHIFDEQFVDRSEELFGILASVHLEGADLQDTHLEGAQLNMAHLEGACLKYANLEKAWLIGGHLDKAELYAANLKKADLHYAHLEEVDLTTAHLDEAYLVGASLVRAYLHAASLEGASFHVAHLEGADLHEAHLEGAFFNQAHLEGADIRLAFFDTATRFEDTVLSNEEYGTVSLADVHWSGTNLTAVKWSQVRMLGDERTPSRLLCTGRAF